MFFVEYAQTFFTIRPVSLQIYQRIHQNKIFFEKNPRKPKCAYKFVENARKLSLDFSILQRILSIRQMLKTRTGSSYVFLTRFRSETDFFALRTHERFLKRLRRAFERHCGKFFRESNICLHSLIEKIEQMCYNYTDAKKRPVRCRVFDARHPPILIRKEFFG